MAVESSETVFSGFELAPAWMQREEQRGKQCVEDFPLLSSRQRCRDPVGFFLFFVVGAMQASWVWFFVLSPGETADPIASVTEAPLEIVSTHMSTDDWLTYGSADAFSDGGPFEIGSRDSILPERSSMDRSTDQKTDLSRDRESSPVASTPSRNSTSTPLPASVEEATGSASGGEESTSTESTSTNSSLQKISGSPSPSVGPETELKISGSHSPTQTSGSHSPTPATETSQSSQSTEVNTNSRRLTGNKNNQKETHHSVRGLLEHLFPEHVHKPGFVSIIVPAVLFGGAILIAGVCATTTMVLLSEMHNLRYRTHRITTLVIRCLLLGGLLWLFWCRYAFIFVPLEAWMIYECIWIRWPGQRLLSHVLVQLDRRCCARKTDRAPPLLAANFRDILAALILSSIVIAKCLFALLGAPVPPSLFVTKSVGFSGLHDGPLDGGSWLILLLVFICCVWDVMFAYNASLCFYAAQLGRRYQACESRVSCSLNLLAVLTTSFGSISLCTTVQVFLQPLFYCGRKFGVSMRSANCLKARFRASLEYYNDFALVQSALRGVSVSDGAAVFSFLARDKDLDVVKYGGYPPVISLVLLWSLLHMYIGRRIGEVICKMAFRGELGTSVGAIAGAIAFGLASASCASVIVAHSRVMLALILDDASGILEKMPDQLTAVHTLVGRMGTEALWND